MSSRIFDSNLEKRPFETSGGKGRMSCHVFTGLSKVLSHF